MDFANFLSFFSRTFKKYPELIADTRYAEDYARLTEKQKLIEVGTTSSCDCHMTCMYHGYRSPKVTEMPLSSDQILYCSRPWSTLSFTAARDTGAKR